MSQTTSESLKNYQHVYFLGIGGIGMSALARWFKHQNFWVGGYDKTPSPLTDQMTGEGMEIHFEDSLDLIPEFIKNEKDKTLVVLTPAIPQAHAEWRYFRDAGYYILKRSQVLGLITQTGFTVAVAGTHGKTTTSSMIAFLLKEAGVGCTVFLGGVSSNFGTNFLLSEKPPQLDFATAIARLKPLLADPSVLKIAHNLKYDATVLARNTRITNDGFASARRRSVSIVRQWPRRCPHHS